MSKKRIQQLEAQLREASEAYYSGADAIISDAEFDWLKDELENLAPDSDFLKEVGAPVDSALKKIGHTIAMGSLKKITKVEEFNTWRTTVAKKARDLGMVLQWKLDGLSIELVYQDGDFVQAITRGDGNIGEDVTHTIKNAKGFPRRISASGETSVRCESMLMLADWEKHFPDKMNARNAASGAVRRTDAKGSEHISCIAFDVVADDVDFDTESDRIAWLTSEGFAATFCKILRADQVEKAVKALEAKRDKLPFEIDGAVVKLNSVKEQEKLGEHHGRPYWARAWKFAAMGGFSVVKGVTWSLGTQGTINPVARIAPVEVGGTTIQNVTLHNMDEIERLGVQVGDEVEVIRAGDVIPKIVRVVSPGKKRQVISVDACPVCGGGVKRDGPRMLCAEGSDCSGAIVSRIKKWIKKRNIMYLGDSNIEKLIGAGVVSAIQDLYDLTADRMVGAGLGRGMADKILVEIEKSREVDLPDFLGSLSIDMLGRSECKNLVGHGIDTLAKWKAITAAEIEALPGYKATKATRISAGVQKAKILINMLAGKLAVREGAKKASSSKLKGKSFVICLTGTMSRSRKQLAADIEAAGHEVLDRVTKELTHLCQSDPTSKSSKSQKAEKLGIPIISEKQLVDLLQ